MIKESEKKDLTKLVESLATFSYGNAQKVDERFDRIESIVETVVKRLDIQQDGISDIKRMVKQFVQSQASHDHFEIDTDRRLTKVEKHLKFV